MYERLLIVVDDAPGAGSAVTEGVALARVHGASVLLVHALASHVIAIGDMAVGMDVAATQFAHQAQATGTRVLEQAAQVAGGQGVACETVLLPHADDAHAVCALARERRCDLIVVAASGANALVRLLSGSLIPQLITISPVAVLVCRPAGPPMAAAGSAEPAGGETGR